LGLIAQNSTDWEKGSTQLSLKRFRKSTQTHLITGGAGFIGSHLADALVARGDEVVILDDLSTGRRENVVHLLEGGQAVFVEGSVLDAELVDQWVERTDSVFHLASVVGVKLVVDHPLESLLRNVRGANVVAHAAARFGRRLLFTSTSEVYGKHSSGALPEDADRLLGSSSKSRWGYANTKAFGEMLAFGYARERGARTVVVRLFNSVGPRQLASYGMVLPRFVSQALEGEALTVYGDGTQSRCFTHVFDTVAGILAVADSERAVGGAYNIGTTQELTIRDLAERVIERTGSSSQIRHIPYEMAYGEGFEELGSRKPDTSAIERLCGWHPRRTIEDAIDDLAALMREGVATEQGVSEPATLTGGLEEAAELSG
jgi:UDP-glucose 4-epimerase